LPTAHSAITNADSTAQDTPSPCHINGVID
jgi:hypothetical protein